MWRQEDELQAMLRESVDRFATSRDTAAQFRRNRTSADGFSREVWREMAEAGWTAMLLPQLNGGADLDMLPALSLAEALGRHLIAEPFVASGVIAATILAASQSHRASCLARNLATGDAVVVLADQEQVGAVGPAMLKTTLRRGSGDGYVLDGYKLFVPAWSDSTVLLVSAALDGVAAIVAVEPGAAGLKVETQRMSDGTICANVKFDRVVLPEDALLLEGEAASAATQLSLARGTLALAAQLEGAARNLLSQTSEYLKQRVQFGEPLANFQSIRHGIASLHLDVELAGASWRSAAAALHEGMTRQVLTKISLAKARCSDVAHGTAKAAIHYHGAFGFTEEANVGLYLNAVLRWASWLGSAPVHRAIALNLSKDGNDHHG